MKTQEPQKLEDIKAGYYLMKTNNLPPVACEVFDNDGDMTVCVNWASSLLEDYDLSKVTFVRLVPEAAMKFEDREEILKALHGLFSEWMTLLDSHLGDAESAIDNGTKAAIACDVKTLKAEAARLGSSLATARQMVKHGLKTGFTDIENLQNN